MEERLGKTLLIRNPARLLKYFRRGAGKRNGAAQNDLGIATLIVS